MALTFDDGPWLFTSELLDILSNRGVKATFYITGNNLGKGMIDTTWRSVLERMYAEGHQLASHTWSHRDLNTASAAIQRSEMIYNEMAFRNIFGFFPTYMRPPYAYCYWSTGCTTLMSELGYHITNMDVDTKDYLYTSPENHEVAKQRFSDGFPEYCENDPVGHITLAHDIHSMTVRNLTEYMIDLTLSRGYTLTTVGECLNDPEENWYRSAGSSDSTSTSTSMTSPVSISTSSSSSPSSTSTMTVSPDQTCGGSSSYTCQGSSFGNCCSHYGFW